MASTIIGILWFICQLVILSIAFVSSSKLIIGR